MTIKCDPIDYNALEQFNKSSVRSSLLLFKSPSSSENKINNNNLSENSTSNLKTTERMRADRKLRSYFPDDDFDNEIDTYSNEMDFKRSKTQTTMKPKQSNIRTESMGNSPHVNLMRDRQSENTSNKHDNSSLIEEQTAEARNLYRDGISRRLPTLNREHPSVVPRTSSRLLYPPAIKMKSSPNVPTSTPHPVSYLNSATPEYNHVSYLTHPNELDLIKITTANPGKFGSKKNFQKKSDYYTKHRSKKQFKSKTIPGLVNHAYFNMGSDQGYKSQTKDTTPFHKPIQNKKSSHSAPVERQIVSVKSLVIIK